MSDPSNKSSAHPVVESVKRVSIVGCSRSGTSIIQKEISLYADLFTLPETSFFLGGLQNARMRAARLHKLQSKLEDHYESVLSRSKRVLNMVRYWPQKVGWGCFLGALMSSRCCAEAWALFLDSHALAEGFDGWVEKSPRHFYHIDLMRRLKQPPRFIFVVRNGRDVVASIIDRARRYRGFNSSVEDAIKLWNESVTVAARESHADDLVCVKYESLVENPNVFLEAIAQFLELRRSRTPTGTEGVTEKTVRVMQPFEAWKANVNKPVAAQENKWLKIFTKQERKQVDRALDWDAYNSIRFHV